MLWDGTYSFLSLSEKTRKSNRLQMSLQRQHFLLSYFKDPECWSGQGLNPRPPAQQTGALPTELTRLHQRGNALIVFNIFPTNSPRKCIKNSLANLYVDIGDYRAKWEPNLIGWKTIFTDSQTLTCPRLHKVCLSSRSVDTNHLGKLCMSFLVNENPSPFLPYPFHPPCNTHVINN